MGKKPIRYPQEMKDMVADLVLKEKISITKAVKQAFEKYTQFNYDDQARRSFCLYLRRRGITDFMSLEETDEFKTAQSKQFDKTKSRFIISWCQCETEINSNLLKNIEAYADFIDASIHIIAGRYKNPTSLNSSNFLKKQEKDKKASWHKDVVKYLDANRHNIHENLCILSDIKTQPTASTPLSGFNSITGLESCIIGHPRMHLKSLPVLDGYPSKIILTTGAVSVENYTDTKSGKKGEFHHTYGFVIVELDGDYFHIRQVTSDKSGEFYDLKFFVKDGKVKIHNGAEAIVFGDLHITETNPKMLDIAIDMADKMNCKNKIILHDVFNGTSINHHEAKQPFLLLKREEEGSNDLFDELNQVVAFFDKYKDCNFNVVKSNHDVFLDRWLNENDWRKNKNKRIYLELASNLMNDADQKGVLPMFLKMNNVTNAYCLGENESLRISDWECGIHGHLGNNGSRGGIVQFKNMNTKNITGHSHSPAREDGSVVVGTLTYKRVGYNNGLSSWLNANAIIFPNSKTELIIIQDNLKYTTLF
jgi:hypothetical protein